jgi:hypothetical protein
VRRDNNQNAAIKHKHTTEPASDWRLRGPSIAVTRESGRVPSSAPFYLSCQPGSLVVRDARDRLDKIAPQSLDARWLNGGRLRGSRGGFAHAVVTSSLKVPQFHL